MISRSWTDSTTSSIFVSALNAKSYHSWLLSDREGAGEHLTLQFLHEYTHHWCFHSLVAASLAAMDLRLCAFVEAFPDGRPLWARDFVSQRCLSRLFQPLAEGLALFAEFDLNNPKLNVRQATPLGAADLCFAFAEGDEVSGLQLQLVRNSDDTLDRKASLYLMQPTEDPEGYFLGYMMVKRFHWTLALRCPELTHEMFMAFIKSYFWDDPIYLKILVSDELDGTKVAQSLIDRFTNRVSNLFTDDRISERIMDFIRRWNVPGPKDFSSAIGVSTEEVAEGNRLGLNIIWHSLDMIRNRGYEVPGKIASPSSVYQAFQNLPLVRSYVVVAACSVLVDRERSRVCFEPEISSSERLWLQVDSKEILLPQSGTYLWLAVLTPLARHLVVVALDGDNNALVSFCVPAIDRNEISELTAFVESWLETNVTVTKIRKRFTECGFSIFDSAVLGETVRVIDEHVLNIYAAGSLPYGAKVDLAKAIRIARVDGVRTLLKGNALGAKLLAAMSMISSSLYWYHQHDEAKVLGFVHMIYLSDYSLGELQEALDRIVAVDPTAILVRRVENQVFAII